MCQTFLSALTGITGTSQFHSTGTEPFFFPQIHVEDVGELAFPLPPAQALELVSVAESAPYGRGSETVHDDQVRKCWQIDAARLSFKSPRWSPYLEQMVAAIGQDLGISGKISAHAYKLLIYGPGGHFKAHRDTEKLEAMFGTLIIALPSPHSGGRLFIRHDGREIVVDFSQAAHLHDFQHAALFADCEHEVEPVLTGYRCCLVYNLVLDHGDPETLNPSLGKQVRSLVPTMARLKEDRTGELTAVLLEHGYTEANLSLKNLKGNDQARARALLAAARGAGFIAHLALVTCHQTGTLEGGDDSHYYDKYDRNRRSRTREPGGETMGEIYDVELYIDHWRDENDQPADLGSYGLDEDDILSSQKFGEGEPDEKEFEGYTGNAGCTMDYWYRRAAIVIWAVEDHEKILCDYDFSGACSAFEKLAENKDLGPGSPFRKLGEALIERLPEQMQATSAYSYDASIIQRTSGALLGGLATARSRHLLDLLLARVPASFFTVCDTTLWSRLHDAFGSATFDGIYQSLISKNFEDHRRALFRHLAGLLGRSEASVAIRAIAARLAALRPLPPRATYGQKTRDPAPSGNSEEASILLRASHELEDTTHRENAMRFLRGDSSLAYVRRILGPVLQENAVQRSLAEPNSLAPAVLAFAKETLAAEIARPLTPYPDWIRPCPPIETRANDPYWRASGSEKESAAFQELASFMANPDAKTHQLKYSQDIRSSIESFISTNFLDLDCITIRRGTPHILSCTKNSNSFLHTVDQREQDQALFDKLARLS